MSTLGFLQDVARRPMEMGAILPSSPALARAMVDHACIEPHHRLLELGAGTGAFTREIVSRFPVNPLVAVEPGEGMAQILRRDFPYARVLAVRAQELQEHLPPQSIDRVVSGLPWALWPRARQADLLDAVLPLLAPGARMVTFHYVHSRLLGAVRGMRALLEEKFEHVEYSPIVWANAPPALVSIADSPRITA